MTSAYGYIQWFMTSNSSADGSSINNMKTSRDSPFLYFCVVKAVFKNCVFSGRIQLESVFVDFDNCSFHNYINMNPSNSLLGLGYKMAYVFFIRCTIMDRSATIIIKKEVELHIHIMQSNLIHSDMWVHSEDISTVSYVVHLTVSYSSINGGILRAGLGIGMHSSIAIGIVQITNTSLINTRVRSSHIGQAAFFIDSCTFIQSSLYSVESIIVYIVNSKFDVECQNEGCALTLTNPNDVDIDTSPINAMCDLFQIKKCNGIYLSNIDFIASKSEGPLLIIEGKQTVVENCTFFISTSLPIHVTRNQIFEVHTKIMKLINVKVNATEVRSLDDIPLFSIHTAELRNVLLFCPMSFKVIEKISEKDNNSQFLCQTDVCQNTEYSLMGHSKLTSVANVYNQTKNVLNQIDVLSELVPSCFLCPVGDSCEQERVVALPNYWGTRKGHVISMYRCPHDYCCQNNESCSDIDSCNGLRTGILCGNCGPSMTESIFSTNCVDSNSCKPGLLSTCIF